jgi:hypothetical protein
LKGRPLPLKTPWPSSKAFRTPSKPKASKLAPLRLGEGFSMHSAFEGGACLGALASGSSPWLLCQAQRSDWLYHNKNTMRTFATKEQRHSQAGD